MKNLALKNAFHKTSTGHAMAVEAKRFMTKKDIAKSIREANNLFYASWVKTCPKNADKAFRIQVFHDLKPRLKTVAIKAVLKRGEYAEEYGHILTAFKYMDFQDALSRIEKYPPIKERETVTK